LVATGSSRSSIAIDSSGLVAMGSLLVTGVVSAGSSTAHAIVKQQALVWCTIRSNHDEGALVATMSAHDDMKTQ